MPPWIDGLTDRLLHRHALRRWHRFAGGLDALGTAPLRGLLIRARQLRRPIDRVIHEAESRLALPTIGSDALRRPAGADWVWRPGPWRRRTVVPGLAGATSGMTLAEGVAVFHDCPLRELVLRQVRNARAHDLAPFGLRLEVFRFEGGFLSLAIDLPDAAVRGLGPRHVIRLDLVTEAERPVALSARLNIRQGPNVTQIVRWVAFRAEDGTAEFDLADADLGARQVESMWMDLIFGNPGMNGLILRDVTLSRRPRADL